MRLDDVILVTASGDNLIIFRGKGSGIEEMRSRVNS